MKILRKACLGSNFTGSYKKKSVHKTNSKRKDNQWNISRETVDQLTLQFSYSSLPSRRPPCQLIFQVFPPKTFLFQPPAY